MKLQKQKPGLIGTLKTTFPNCSQSHVQTSAKDNDFRFAMHCASAKSCGHLHGNLYRAQDLQHFLDSVPQVGTNVGTHVRLVLLVPFWGIPPSTKQRQCLRQNNSSFALCSGNVDFFNLNVIFPARSLKWLKFILDSCCNLWRTSPETVSNRQPCDGIRCCFQCLGIWTGPAAFCTSSGWAPWRYCFSHSCGYSMPKPSSNTQAFLHSDKAIVQHIPWKRWVFHTIPKTKNAFQACHEKCSTQIKGKSS